MEPRLAFRDSYSLVKDYILSHAVQLYVGAMFTLMAALRMIETNQIVGGLWWAVIYMATAHLIAAGLIWKGSRALSAATGAVIAVVAAARMSVIAQAVYPALEARPEDAARGAVALLLWGLVVVIGMRWPRVTFEAELRELLQESRDEPDLTLPLDFNDRRNDTHGVV